MHLSDQELMELDASGKLHLSECEHCQQKLNNLNQFREKFSQLPKMSMNKNGWQSIKQDYLYELKEKENESAKKQLFFWRSSSVGLAASLLIMVLWQLNLDSDINIASPDNQLSQLIAHNQMLQKEFAQHAQINMTSVSLVELKHELSLVDIALRDAYEQKQSNEQKAQLWQKRQELMKKMLHARDKRQIMNI